MTSIPFAAIDWGYSYTKIATGDRVYLIPSMVSSGYPLGFDFGKKEDVDSMEVMTPEGHFFIGELANTQGRIFHHSIRQDRYKGVGFDALIKASLALSFPEDGEVNVVTGLPPKFYGSHKPILESLLKQEHTFQFRGKERHLTVKSVKILPQLVGTMIDLLYEEDGTKKDTDRQGKTIGIIDPGFGTTDLGVVSKGTYKNDMVDSIRYNMHEVGTHVKHLLYNQLNIELDDPLKLDRIVREGTVHMNGESLNIRHMTDWSKKTVALAIANHVSSAWLRTWEIDHIYVTGGGGELLYPFLKEELPVSLVPSPQLANVRGYLKTARREWA